MNCFYAAVELLHRPELRGRPVVVGGHEEMRHGIVLAKNLIAKRFGIQTGMSLVEARQQCPELVTIPPDYHLYMEFSRLARAIYYDYTDLVEPFGPDEAWLDVTGSVHLWGNDSRLIAEEISERVKAELGVSVSVGLSWNKIFAKFGSDYRKPDAVTIITPENYRQIVWTAPVGELLYVGRATRNKLAASAIHTIGELACEDERLLRNKFGKIGPMLQLFAQGGDITPVKVLDPQSSTVDYEIKSIGNGLTAPHDIVDERDGRLLVSLLSESVAQRLREQRLKARTICITVRDSADLSCYSRQAPLPQATNITREINAAAFALLAANEPLDGSRPLRTLGVRAANLVDANLPQQLSIFGDEQQRLALERLDSTIDELRRRFGNNIVRRAVALGDEQMTPLDICRDNVVHPVGFLHR
ncbi:MAG: DNA polymerase IV [Coriobacteriales bacterium]|jgi:DNA polymerase-4|nr:DNA polymerase IV [Coriobacteriales bacterium]